MDRCFDANGIRTNLSCDRGMADAEPERPLRIDSGSPRLRPRRLGPNCSADQPDGGRRSARPWFVSESVFISIILTIPVNLL